MISRELYDFFVSWRSWVRNGAPDKNPFYRRYGLCDNVRRGGFPVTGRIELETVLEKEFESYCDPFGVDWHRLHPAYGYCHTNPQRLAFVDQMIAEYEAQKETA